MSETCFDGGLARRLVQDQNDSCEEGDDATPFVHRFQTPGQKYVYDVNTRRISRVGPVVWDLLADYGRLSDQEMVQKHAPAHGPKEVQIALAEIAVAQEKGLFLSHRPTAVGSASPQRVQQKLQRHREQLILNVTESCNLRCAYCIYGGAYQNRRQHSARSMTWDIAKRAIDEFLAHSDLAEDKCITFYGGEPLLNLPLIRQAVAYAKDAGNIRRFGMTTNACLLKGDAASFLGENDFVIVVSLDGPQAVHDKQRRTAGGQTTWQTVMENLRDFLAAFPQYRRNGRLRFNAVAMADVDLLQVQEFFSQCDVFTDSMGLELSEQTPAREQKAPEAGQAILDSGRAIYAAFLEALVDGSLGANRASRSNWVRLALFEKPFLLFHKRGFLSPCLPETLELPNICIPGSRRTFVSADGQYYACERVIECEAGNIGNVYSGVDGRKVLSLLERWASSSGQECRSCWCLPTCAVGCFATVGPEGEVTEQAKQQACQNHRRQTHQTLVEYCKILEQNPKAFDYTAKITLS